LCEAFRPRGGEASEGASRWENCRAVPGGKLTMSTTSRSFAYCDVSHSLASGLEAAEEAKKREAKLAEAW